MAQSKYVREDRCPELHVLMAADEPHPDDPVRVESAVEFAVEMKDDLGYEVVRWREIW